MSKTWIVDNTPKKKSHVRSFIDMLITFVLTCLIFVCFRYFVRFPVVNGTSMEPTYHDGDKLIVLFTDRVNENDIVICWSDPLDEYLVKRVIGVPGDVIEIKNGALYRNGNRVYEAYIKDVIWDLESDESITLGDDEFFLLGDNRNDSIDSRNLGAIERDDIFGKVLLNWTKFTSSE